MAAARDLLRRAEANGVGLNVGGEPLTAERVKTAISQAFVAHGCTSDDCIVARGAQAAVGHDMGSGQIRAGETVVIDLWPRDAESFCFADMTRTFVVGEIAPDVAEWHRLCKEALDRAISEIRPGVSGRAVNLLAKPIPGAHTASNFGEIVTTMRDLGVLALASGATLDILPARPARA